MVDRKWQKLNAKLSAALMACEHRLPIETPEDLDDLATEVTDLLISQLLVPSHDPPMEGEHLKWFKRQRKPQ